MPHVLWPVHVSFGHWSNVQSLLHSAGIHSQKVDDTNNDRVALTATAKDGLQIAFNRHCHLESLNFPSGKSFGFKPAIGTAVGYKRITKMTEQSQSQALLSSLPLSKKHHRIVHQNAILYYSRRSRCLRRSYVSCIDLEPRASHHRPR